MINWITKDRIKIDQKSNESLIRFRKYDSNSKSRWTLHSFTFSGTELLNELKDIEYLALGFDPATNNIVFKPTSKFDGYKLSKHHASMRIQCSNFETAKTFEHLPDHFDRDEQDITLHFDKNTKLEYITIPTVETEEVEQLKLFDVPECSNDKNKMIAAYVDEDTNKRFIALCEKSKITKSSLARYLLMTGIEKMEKGE